MSISSTPDMSYGPAIGALAVSRLAIRRLAVDKAKVRSLALDELDVKRLRVGELVIADEIVTPPSKLLEPIAPVASEV